MQKYNFQTALRISQTPKNEIDMICDQNQIRPSDFMWYAIKEIKELLKRWSKPE